MAPDPTPEKHYSAISNSYYASRFHGAWLYSAGHPVLHLNDISSRLIYEATRFHHATRRCGGVAPCGPHAADWLIADAMLLPYDFFG
jgi:hypothetical protein